jgi:hypothetical protein
MLSFPHKRVAQDALLAVDADFLQQDVARITQQLIIIHRGWFPAALGVRQEGMRPITPVR